MAEKRQSQQSGNKLFPNDQRKAALLAGGSPPPAASTRHTSTRTPLCFPHTVCPPLEGALSWDHFSLCAIFVPFEHRPPLEMKSYFLSTAAISSILPKPPPLPLSFVLFLSSARNLEPIMLNGICVLPCLLNCECLEDRIQTLFLFISPMAGTK